MDKRFCNLIHATTFFVGLFPRLGIVLHYLLMIESAFGSAATCTNSNGAGVSNAANW